MPKKTYIEKLAHIGDLPKIEETSDARQIAAHGGPRMLVAPPVSYDALMRLVPVGRLTTSTEIRAHLAKEAGADYTCQLTAGIFINIAAHASDERNGTAPTPYHRTLKKGGELNEKYPGGIESQKQRLSAEGHEFIQKGKRVFIKDYEKKLHSLEK